MLSGKQQKLNKLKIYTKSVYSNMSKKFFLPPTAESKIIRYGFTQDSIYRLYKLPFRPDKKWHKNNVSQ